MNKRELIKYVRDCTESANSLMQSGDLNAARDWMKSALVEIEKYEKRERSTKKKEH